MSLVQNIGSIQKKAAFEVLENPHHRRLYHILLDESKLAQLFEQFSDTSVQHLEYVPYARLILANRMKNLFGDDFVAAIRNILHDRATGGFTIGVQGQTRDHDDYVKFSTALTHLVGKTNFDAMSGTYYARFTVKHTDNSDSYLRQAYRLFTLHTDGTFVEEQTDWLLMMKMEERNAIGGESRILHLDDWEELDKYSSHPLASVNTKFASPPSKNVSQEIHRPVFFLYDNKPCICFIDQFICPDTIEQAVYLDEMSRSLEKSPSTIAFPLPEGDLVMINNLFWMHGRAAFEPNPDLYRELLRQRGCFGKTTIL